MKYKELIDKMTLEQKASLLSGKNFWETMDYQELGINSIFLADGPHGIRKQAAAADQLGLNPSLPATCFPTASALANTFNVDLLQEMGEALGEEAKLLKVNILLGPGVNIKRNHRCGRNFEYFSEDPYLAGKEASALIKGIQSQGVSACVKHYACNSQELRRISSSSEVDERALREIYLEPFEIAVKEGKTKSIMTAYNAVNGTYANENEHLLKDILRTEWGFDGLVVTDWGGENDRIAGLKCTNDLEMPGNNGDTDREVIKAVQDGTLDISYVDESVDRILDIVFDTEKAFEGYVKPVVGEGDEKKTGMNCFEDIKNKHHELARKVASEAIVLLKNEENILPLKGSEKVAGIGSFASSPRYQGAGSSIVNCTKLPSFLDLKDQYGFEFVGYEEGYNRYGKKSEKMAKKALQLVSKADTVIYFLGLDEVTESEGLDRASISIPENQIALLQRLNKTGKKIIAVLSAGSVTDLSFERDCNALVYTALTGQASAEALLDVLKGVVNPSGRLSETYPLKEEDVPFNSEYSLDVRNIEYKESIFVGYRYYDTASKPVKYPFGYGLSYTTFAYSDLRADSNGVTFKIKNTGSVKGKEVVQVYIGKKDSAIFRARKELKAFAKVELEPGEEREVQLKFDDKAFRFFNVKSNEFEIEGGTYQVYVNRSVLDNELMAEVEVDGTMTAVPYSKEFLPSYFKGDITSVTEEEFDKLLNRERDKMEFKWYKKKRMIIDGTCLFSDLRYSKRWIGRLVAWGLRTGIKFTTAIGKKNVANAIIMGPYSFPIRAFSRMMGFPMDKVEGFIAMCNGHFFKGLKRFLCGSKNGPKTPKYKKENHYLAVK